jgi:nucleotide-binding universal stress UspA family protein
LVHRIFISTSEGIMWNIVETARATLEGPDDCADECRNAASCALRRTGPLLVPVDGGATSGAALMLAAALSARDGDWIDALNVELPLTNARPFRIPARVVRAAKAPLLPLGALRQQLLAALPGNQWNLRLEFGRLGETIAHVARRRSASLIVMDLGDGEGGGRAVNVNGIAQVLRQSDTPVFAVPAAKHLLPYTAVALIDGSSSSFRAAREALAVLQPFGTLHLLHVRSRIDSTSGESSASDAIYETDVANIIAKLAREWTSDKISLKAHVILGTVMGDALAFVHAVNADLIACGTNGFGTISRTRLGHVPIQLLHEASCSVLVARTTHG